MSLSNMAAERAVLAGLCKYGSDIYLDICDYVKDGSFHENNNKMVYKCIEHLCKDKDNIKIDLPSIQSAAKELNLDHIIDRPEVAKHLNTILRLPVERENVRTFAGKIRRLEVARLLHDQCDVAKDKIANTDGTESVAELIGMTEDVFFDFSSLMDDDNNNPVLMGDSIEDYLKYLEENPITKVGVSTGFPNWDEAIGGGLRKGSLNVLGARAKVGKTLLTDNMGYHISSDIGDEPGIPVLNLDTEMLLEDHRHRTLAMLSEIDIQKIETGQFAQTPDGKSRVYQAAKEMEKAKYFHKSIAGLRFEDQISVMRRWLQKEVGLHEDGTAKDCVIIYDYLKLMSADGVSDSMSEFQALGFMMSTLHNFAVRYKVPFLVLIQLNRDGINKESSDAAAGSDRIIWLCSNFTIFKKKSAEEIAEDGPTAGNRKMVVTDARHGSGVEFGDYINCHMLGDIAKITEGDLKSQLGNERGFEDDDEAGEQLDF